MVTLDTMEDQTKTEVYHSTLLKALNTNGELKEHINQDIYQIQFRLIHQNLISSVKSDRVRAFQMLQILIDNRVQTILKDVLSILENGNIEENVKRGIIDSVSHSMLTTVRQLLVNKDVKGLASLHALWQNYTLMFPNILKTLYSHPGNRDNMKTILFDHLIPIMLEDTKNPEDPMKIIFIDLGLDMARVVSIKVLSSKEYSVYSGKIIEFVSTIASLRDAGFTHWHKLWMFLIRLLGTRLHTSMSLMNKLLRVVEQSFKSSCIEQRLKSYQCWKELIDNASLDKNYLCTEKQIKLLLTPLKAKFAYQVELILIRFDHFVYLMEKLQDKAVLVVKEFLEFCFGEIGGVSPKPGQGKTVPELWLRIAEVLVQLMGHSHQDVDHCLNPELDLKPVLKNHTTHIHLHIINAVSECSKLMKEVELNQKRTTLLRCFWKSLLSIVSDSQPENRKACVESISDVLDSLLKETDPYFHSIAIIIFKEAVSMDSTKVADFLLNNLERILRIIFLVPLCKESYIEVEKFIALISNLSTNGETQKILGKIFKSFGTFRTIDTNANFVAEIWIHLANEAEDYSKWDCMEFFRWPIANAHKLTEQVTRKTLYEHYERLIVKKVEKSWELQLTLFKNVEKTLKNDPLLLKNVLDLVTLFSPNYSTREICDITLDILSFILLIPSTSNEPDRQRVELYLKKIIETNSQYFQEESTIKKLCSCIETLLKLRLFDSLVPLEDALRNFSDNTKNIYKKYLSLDFLGDIFVTETDISITEKVHGIIKHLRDVKLVEPKKPVLVMGGRASKIAHLVKQIPVSPKKEQKSPFKVFGSQLKSAKTAQKSPKSSPLQKKKPSINLDDDSNSKFVLINSEVKLDKDKLTEHQKETLNKRREDIPALYQDLSQSVSQSDSMETVLASKVKENRVKKEEVFKKPEVPEVKVLADPMEEELPSLPSSTNSSFEEKTIEEPSTETELPDSSDRLEASKEITNFTKKRKNEIKRLAMNIVGAEEFVGVGSKRTRKTSPNDAANKPKTKKRKPKDNVITERKPIIIETKATTNEPNKEQININKTVANHIDQTISRVIKKANKRNERENSKRMNKSTSAIESKEDLTVTYESDDVVFKTKRKSRKSMSDAQAAEDVRKSKRRSLPSSRMNDILQMLKSKSVSPSRNPKKNNPETQSELFPASDEQPKEEEESLKRKRIQSTSDEDEDIIESSQESSVATASLSKNRLSIGNSVINQEEEKEVFEEPVVELTKIDTNAESKMSSKKVGRGPARKKGNAALLEDSINEPDQKRIEICEQDNLEKRETEAVKSDSSLERNELEMSTEEIQQKSTQSQDTQTQDTESIVLDTESTTKVQIFLDLPEKPVLTESDKEIARMDTASLSMVDLEELSRFNNSTTNKTIIDNRTLVEEIEVVEEAKCIEVETEVIGETENVIEQAKDDLMEIEENGKEESINKPIDEIDKGIAEDKNVNVIPETEVFTQVDESSPVKAGGSPTCAGTPTATSSNLPSSPITGDTPNRTSELLNDTNDISPIRSKFGTNLSSSDEETEQRKFVPVALIFDEEVVDHEELKEKSPERGDDAPEKIMEETSPEKAEKEGDSRSISTMPSSASSPPKVKMDKEVVEKSSKASWIKQGSPATKSIFNRRKIGLPLRNMSPSASRIKKLMSNVKPSSQGGEKVEEFLEADILTFKREVPSPLAIPRSSILKRKHSDVSEEGSSPCPKRKRVNFSDPCTTSKKVFIKEEPQPRPPAITALTRDDIDKKFMELMGMGGEPENDVEDIEPVNSMEESPIYPELVQCEEDLLLLGPDLRISELGDENILTIGDLARQTETSLAKLSPNKPMALHVFKALQNYHKESKRKDGSSQHIEVVHLMEVLPVNGESEEKPKDALTELQQVLERAKSENLPLETILLTITDSIGQKSLPDLVTKMIGQNNEEMLQCFRSLWNNLVKKLPPVQLMQLTHELQLKILLKD